MSGDIKQSEQTLAVLRVFDSLMVIMPASRVVEGGAARRVIFEALKNGDRMLSERDMAVQALDKAVAAAQRADSKLERAENTLKRHGFTDLGGAEWKPPVWNKAVLEQKLNSAEHRISDLVFALDQVKTHAAGRRGLDFNLPTEVWKVIHAAMAGEKLDKPASTAADPGFVSKWYPPLTTDEIKDLTAMVDGAPASMLYLRWLSDMLAKYEELRAVGKRPEDPAKRPAERAMAESAERGRFNRAVSMLVEHTEMDELTADSFVDLIVDMAVEISEKVKAK